MTERVRKIKEEPQNTRPVVSTERIKFLLDTYKETEGEPPVIRRAVCLAKHLMGKAIFIDGNPVVGTTTKHTLGGEFYPEWTVDGMVPGQKFATSGGGTELPVDLPEEDKRLLDEARDYWKNNCTVARTKKIWSQKYIGKDIDRIRNHIVWWDSADRPVHRTVVDFEKVLRKGMKGIIRQAEDKLREFPIDKVEGQKQRQFLSAVIMVLEAAIGFAKRYAALAQETADIQANESHYDTLSAKLSLLHLFYSFSNFFIAVPFNIIERLILQKHILPKNCPTLVILIY